MESLLLGKWCRHVKWSGFRSPMGATKTIVKGQIVAVNTKSHKIQVSDGDLSGALHEDSVGETFATLLLKDNSISVIKLDAVSVICNSEQEMNNDD